MTSSLILPKNYPTTSDKLCQVLYGLEHCGNPAKWKIIMTCCGGSDFLCHDCLQDVSQTEPSARPDYFACGLCGKTHHSWRRGVKEVSRI